MNDFEDFIDKWTEIESLLKHNRKINRAFDEEEQKILEQAGFRQLGRWERNKLKNERTSQILIEEAKEQGEINTEEYEKLLSIKSIRNAYIHAGSQENLGKFLSITQTCLNDMDAIIAKLEKNSQIKWRMKRFEAVRWCSLDDNVHEEIRIMRENDFTHIPVLIEKNVVIGILSDDAIVNYIFDEGLFAKDKKVRELLSYIGFESAKTRRAEDFIFLPETTPIHEVKEKLQESMDKIRRVSLFLITKNGKENEPLKGIFTIWDLFSGGVH